MESGDGAVGASHGFGRRLRCARIEQGMTQEQLGHLVDMNSSNIGRIERGTANPSLLTMTRLAAALGTDLGQLLRGIPGGRRP